MHIQSSDSETYSGYLEIKWCRDWKGIDTIMQKSSQEIKADHVNKREKVDEKSITKENYPRWITN